jgi:hypothetical protein
MPALEQALAPTADRTRTGHPRLKHAAIPGSDPPLALCGARIGRAPAGPAGEKCVVCLDLAQRRFIGR